MIFLFMLVNVSYVLLQDVRGQVQWMPAVHPDERARDARAQLRVPPAVLRVRRVRPPAPEGRPVCRQRRTVVLQDGFRKRI